MTDWKKVQGSQEEKPMEFDTASSGVVVYQRRNVERVETEDFVGWEYEEREMSREEYAMLRTETQQKQIEQMRADIDFISAMTDIEL